MIDLIPIDQMPTVCEGVENRTLLQQQLMQVERELQDKTHRKPRRSAAIAMVVGADDLNPATDLPFDAGEPDAEYILTGPERDEKQARRRELAEAIHLQEKVNDRRRGEVSKEIVGKLKSEYGKLIQRVAAALRELAEAGQAERAFREGIIDAGYSFTSSIVPVVVAASLSDAHDPNATLQRFIREAAVADYVVAADYLPPPRGTAWKLSTEGSAK